MISLIFKGMLSFATKFLFKQWKDVHGNMSMVKKHVINRPSRDGTLTFGIVFGQFGIVVNQIPTKKKLHPKQTPQTLIPPNQPTRRS